MTKLILKINKKVYFSIIGVILISGVLLGLFSWSLSWKTQEGETDVYAGYMNVSDCTSKDDFPHAGGGNLNANISLDALVTGIDGGSLTIGTGKMLQLGPNVSFVFNPGESISPIGQIDFSNGAKIVKGYLWMKDADNDGCGLGLNDVTWTSSTTSPGADWRRIKDISYYPDPNDSSAGDAPGCIDCVSESYESCDDNDVYWYDSCDVRDEKAQECGSDSCTAWGSRYCSSGDVYERRTCYDKGCSDSSCYSNSNAEQRLADNCNNNESCQNGVCVASCQDKCSYSGKKACCGSWGEKTCGNYDSDSCLEWSSCSNCGTDRCVGTTWRDYYCTGSKCTYRSYYNDSRCAPAVCTPKTCSQLGKSCGYWNDGCGKQINCGTCPSSTYKSCSFSWKCPWQCIFWLGLGRCTVTYEIPSTCSNGRCVNQTMIPSYGRPCCIQ